MSSGDKKLPSRKSSGDAVSAFLGKLAVTPAYNQPRGGGRLLFAIDATASREPTWDMACHLQAAMFAETTNLGGLEIQLCYYRGFGEFKSTPWLKNSGDLIQLMTKVACLAGRTQICKVLRHAVTETKRQKVNAVILVSDVVEEDIDELGHQAGELGLLGTPTFIFHEGGEPSSQRVFRQIAKLSGGAYCAFDAGSARQLRDLLTAVAVFSAGGRRALADYGRKTGGKVRQLTHQLQDGNRS